MLFGKLNVAISSVVNPSRFFPMPRRLVPCATIKIRRLFRISGTIVSSQNGMTRSIATRSPRSLRFTSSQPQNRFNLFQCRTNVTGIVSLLETENFVKSGIVRSNGGSSNYGLLPDRLQSLIKTTESTKPSSTETVPHRVLDLRYFRVKVTFLEETPF